LSRLAGDDGRQLSAGAAAALALAPLALHRPVRTAERRFENSHRTILGNLIVNAASGHSIPFRLTPNA
jgi:hypothetical protein